MMYCAPVVGSIESHPGRTLFPPQCVCRVGNVRGFVTNLHGWGGGGGGGVDFGHGDLTFCVCMRKLPNSASKVLIRS